MQKPIALFIILTIVAGKVDVDFWKSESPKLRKEFVDDLVAEHKRQGLPGKAVTDHSSKEYQALLKLSKTKTGLLKSFMQQEEFAHIAFDKLMGQGSYGSVYRGVREDVKEDPVVPTNRLVSLKILWEANKEAENCFDAYHFYTALVAAGVTYLVETFPPVKAGLETPALFLCGVLMEFANPAKQSMFAPTPSDRKREENTNEFLAFARRLLSSFYQINHVAGYYHGDVKPDNVLWKRTDRGLEPRVIDFDLVFRKVSPHYNPGNIIYTTTYRPPELREIVPETNPTRPEKARLAKYKYDADFREEAWSVGKTLDKILATNRGEINSSDERMGTLRQIIRDMTRYDIGERICTQTAWERAAGIPSESGVGLQVDRHII